MNDLNADSCCDHGAKLDRIIELLEPRKPIRIETGPVGYQVKNGSGNEDCVWITYDDTHYNLGYHGLIKRIPMKDFHWGQDEIEAVRQELEEQLKATPPNGHTEDGRPYWL